MGVSLVLAAAYDGAVSRPLTVTERADDDTTVQLSSIDC